EDHQATGAALARPYHLSSLAEGYRSIGKIETALTVVNEALTIIDKTEECWYESEIYRLKGRLMLQSQTSPRQVSDKPKTSQNQSGDLTTQHLAPRTQAEAETYFLKAIDIARQQQAKSLELRAVMSLSRLWRAQGK